MPLTDQLRHEAVQESQHQRIDMCSVDIGIRHNDDLVITKLGNVKFFVNSGSKGCDHCLDFFIAVNPIFSCLLDIQNFASEGKNCLRKTISRALGGAACGITLYEEYFTVLRILIRAIGKLSGK